jgi:tRNA nucleotidyltransferase (CCA-adding enzyme)
MSSRLFKEVLGRIRPSRREREEELLVARRLIRKIASVRPKGCRVVLTGSVAKGTFLRDSRDIDVFVLFPTTYPKAGLERAIEGTVKRAFPGTGYRLSYAEHPYARFHFQGRRVDLVPAYAIKGAQERRSAVDRSVLHTKYVLGHMGQGRKGEVLLLKQFLKANGLYGAEIKTEGFSGYLCELLIVQYGSFAKLLSAAQRWKFPMLIDVGGFYRGQGKKGREALFAGFGSGFVVIDPTDRGRNVAAAVSPENAARFASLARKFRQKPSADFFFRKPPSFGDKAARLASSGHAYVITLMRPDAVDDVLWGQLKKAMKQLSARLREDGFSSGLPGFGMEADDSGGLLRIAFVVDRAVLPHSMMVQGPPISMLEPTLNFMRHHRHARFARRKGRLLQPARREVRTPEQSVAAFFSSITGGKSRLSHPLAIARLPVPRKKRK